MANRLRGSGIALIGHPFAPIGMGEHVRCSFRAFRSVGVLPRLVDLYGLNTPEADADEELSAHVATTTREINVFHINGDEVSQALATLAYRSGPKATYNVVFPAWELAHYPEPWARELNRFNEIWAPSAFIRDAIAEAVDRPVLHMPLACEVVLSNFIGRRWFGIPEGSFVFLFSYDMRSYSERKNPEAVIAAFREVLRRRPFSPCHLVLKVNGVQLAPAAFRELEGHLADLRDRVTLIDKPLTDNEVKNLVRCCDCFVSLHRAEGFGRGMSEAMVLGKPVVATGYSGNLDFMTSQNSLLVRYRLVPVPPNAYPFWEHQVWAEPDHEEAAAHMVSLLDDPALGRKIGRQASLDVRTKFGYRAAGVRYLDRLAKIVGEHSIRPSGETRSLEEKIA